MNGLVLENINDYEFIYEMANYDTRDSGLPYNIWFDEGHSLRKGKHKTPRVKVQVGDNLIPVSVSTQPEILLKGHLLSEAERVFSGSDRKKVFDFITKNYGVIISHWNGEITTKAMLNALKP